MQNCTYSGQTELQRTATGIKWLRADAKIHVDAAIVGDPQAVAELRKLYDVGEWCDELGAWHADRRHDTAERAQ